MSEVSVGLSLIRRRPTGYGSVRCQDRHRDVALDDALRGTRHQVSSTGPK